MKIGVLGSGKIGGTLGRKWAAAGHEVTFGARDPSSSSAAALAPEIGASVAPVDDAVRDADVVLFAIPAAAMADTVKARGTICGTGQARVPFPALVLPMIEVR